MIFFYGRVNRFVFIEIFNIDSQLSFLVQNVSLKGILNKFLYENIERIKKFLSKSQSELMALFEYFFSTISFQGWHLYSVVFSSPYVMLVFGCFRCLLFHFHFDAFVVFVDVIESVFVYHLY